MIWYRRTSEKWQEIDEMGIARVEAVAADANTYAIFTAQIRMNSKCNQFLWQ